MGLLSWLEYFVYMKEEVSVTVYYIFCCHVTHILWQFWKGISQHILGLYSFPQEHRTNTSVYFIYICFVNILHPVLCLWQKSLFIQNGFHVSVSDGHYYPKLQLIMGCNPLIQIGVSFNTLSNYTVYFCVVSSAHLLCQFDCPVMLWISCDDRALLFIILPLPPFNT